MNRTLRHVLIEGAAILLSVVIFWVPFYYVILNSFKSVPEAADMNVAWPKTILAIQNYSAVLRAADGMVIRAFINSTLLTVLSIAVMILVCSMAGFVMQRRSGKGQPVHQFPRARRSHDPAFHRTDHLGPEGSGALQDLARDSCSWRWRSVSRSPRCSTAASW